MAGKSDSNSTPATKPNRNNSNVAKDPKRLDLAAVTQADDDTVIDEPCAAEARKAPVEGKRSYPISRGMSSISPTVGEWDAKHDIPIFPATGCMVPLMLLVNKFFPGLSASEDDYRVDGEKVLFVSHERFGKEVVEQIARLKPGYAAIYVSALSLDDEIWIGPESTVAKFRPVLDRIDSAILELQDLLAS